MRTETVDFRDKNLMFNFQRTACWKTYVKKKCSALVSKIQNLLVLSEKLFRKHQLNPLQSFPSHNLLALKDFFWRFLLFCSQSCKIQAFEAPHFVSFEKPVNRCIFHSEPSLITHEFVPYSLQNGFARPDMNYKCRGCHSGHSMHRNNAVQETFTTSSCTENHSQNMNLLVSSAA